MIVEFARTIFTCNIALILDHYDDMTLNVKKDCMDSEIDMYSWLSTLSGPKRRLRQKIDCH